MNTVVVGLQFGDEGKGKIVDKLAADHDWVVRYQGGANAGHTLYNDSGEKIVLHQIPSGILQNKNCFIGNGCVVDLEALKEEMEMLREHGVIIDHFNLKISPKAHVLTFEHKFADVNRNGHIGTTKKGIGPAYEDKVARKGTRVGDLLAHNEYNWLRPLVVDALPDMIRNGNVLFEGAQGTMLDIDHGTYPFVTSSNCTAGGACTGTGFPPNKIDRVVGVAKAYVTRVGNGPLPTELPGAAQDQLRELGKEYGATTGRPRRCGWLDIDQLRYACMINGVDEIYLTKLDILKQMPASYICSEEFGRIAFGNHHTLTTEQFAKSFCSELKRLLDIKITASVGPKRNDIMEF